MSKIWENGGNKRKSVFKCPGRDSGKVWLIKVLVGLKLEIDLSEFWVTFRDCCRKLSERGMKFKVVIVTDVLTNFGVSFKLT